MNEKLVVLNFGLEPDDALLLRALHEGQKLCPPGASRTELMKKTDIDAVFLLRLFLGVPASEMTLPRTRFAAAVMSLLDGLPPSHGESLITTDDGGQPWLRLNPSGGAPDLNEAVPDLEFIESYGLPQKVWAEIFGSDTLLKRFKPGDAYKPEVRVAEVHRAFLALTIFGFPDPRQFFRTKAA